MKLVHFFKLSIKHYLPNKLFFITEYKFYTIEKNIDVFDLSILIH